MKKDVEKTVVIVNFIKKIFIKLLIKSVLCIIIIATWGKMVDKSIEMF